MASDASRTHYQALLVQDPRLRDPSCLWTAQSSFSQAGPRPGVPEPGSSSEMVLQASGEQASGSSIEILAHKAGMPGPGGGGFVWRNAGDTNYRGWDVPTVISGWEAVEWTDGGAGYTVREVGAPHAITLDDHTVIATAQVRVVVLGITTYRVYVWVRDATTGAWTSQSVYSQSASPTFGFWPCLLKLPSGRVLLYYYVEDTANDEVQVQLQYSDDDGATWTVGSVGVLADPIDTSGSPGAGADGGDPGRIRVAYRDGQCLMVCAFRAHDETPHGMDVFLQFASSDLGCSYDQVGAQWDGDISGDGWGGYHELVVLGAQFCMFWIAGSSNERVFVNRVSNAFERLADASAEATISAGTWATDSGGATGATLTDGDLAVWVDDDGTVYMLGRMTDAANEIVLARSFDGEAWEMLGTSDFSTGFTSAVAKVFDSDDASTYLKNLAVTRQGSRAVMLHNWAANPGDEDNSLGAAYLGGWSTVTMPAWGTARTDDHQVSWTYTGLPIELPSDAGWTGAGTGTATLTDGALNLSTAADTVYFSMTPTTTAAQGIILRRAVQVVSGGSLAAEQVGMTIQLADGTNDRQVSIRIWLNGSNHEIRCYDVEGAAQIGSDIVVTGTDGVDFIVSMSSAGFAIWVRPRTLGTDREFALGASTTSLTNDTGSPAAANLLRWGHDSVGTAESNWWEWHHVVGASTGSSVDALSDGQTNPDDLFPRTISPEYVYVDSGVKVRAIDGPCLRGETWDVATRYEYGIERIFPGVSASPRVKWRSTDTSEQRIALAFDASLLGTVESALGNSAIGLHLSGINWRTGEWQGYDVDTASWVTIADIDTSDGMTGLDYTRQGNTVVPTTGAAGDQPYLHLGECAGWSFSYDGTTFRKVRANTEGRWDRTSGTVKRPTLILEGVEAGDPSSGSAGYLIPTSYTCVVYTSAKYAGYRLVIDSQTTADGYFTIGSLVPGPVVIFGTPYGWGRVVETEAGAELTEARDRTTRSRVPAPPRRTVEFSWAEVHLYEVEQGDPDYALVSTTTGVPPGATERDISYVWDGLVGLLDGAHRHVVYLPRLDKGPPDTIHLNRRHEHLYGRMIGSVRVESVVGDELEDELVRVATVTVREEV